MHDCPEIEHKIARFGDIRPENREMHSVLSTALVQPRWLDSPEIRRDMTGKPINFETIKERPTTIYLMLPPRRLRTHSAWLRLCIAAAVQKLMKDTRKAKVPVMIIMDEYYALAEGDNFPVISKNYAMFREYGVKIMQVWQTLSQMQELSPRGFEAFIGNAGVVQFFTPQDPTTSEYVSRLTGQTTRSFVSTTRGKNPNPALPGGVQLSLSGAQQFIPFPLSMAQDVRNVDPGYSIAFSHQWKGGMRCFTQWPGDVRQLRHIMEKNPSN